MDYDAIIVGASLSGCTAAILLGEAGWRVALLDRVADPGAYKKLCSHHLHSSATPVLHRLGLQVPLMEAGAVRNGMQAHTPWGWIRPNAALNDAGLAHGYNVRREVLDPLLRGRAADTPGVHLLLEHRVEALVRHTGRVQGVMARHRGHSRRLTAPLVVAADGRHSAVARLAECRERRSPNGRVAYFAYYRGVRFATPNDSLIWFGNPDYAFAFPNENGIAQIGCYPGRATAARWKDAPEAHFEHYLRAFPDFPSFERSQRTSRLMCDHSLENLSRKPVAPGLALIGDAALSSDPIWGSGCTWALQSGALLADHLSGARNESALRAALAQYARSHRRLTRWEQVLMNDYSRCRRFNAVERLMFSAAARDAVMATHLHAYGSRLIPATRFLGPSALLRAAAVRMGWRSERAPPPVAGSSRSAQPTTEQP